MVFSILIATISEREAQFRTLLEYLQNQIKQAGLINEVEILFHQDDRVVPVGLKRTMLIRTAAGKFSAFVDDDDWVAPDYVSKIVTTIKDNPDIDVIGIRGILEYAPSHPNNKPFIHSIAYQTYGEEIEKFTRPPNHLNPIRREHIATYTFNTINVGEDFDFAMNLVKKGCLKKEVLIPDIMYTYRFNVNTSATQDTDIVSTLRKRLQGH
jgi:hypothetical protein